MPEPKQYEPNWADPFYKLRYGVGVNEKFDITDRGLIPGSKAAGLETDQAKIDEADRYTSGYLFGKQHPYIGEFATRIANAVRHPIASALVPTLLPFRDDPAQAAQLHQTALDAVRSGARSAFDEEDERKRAEAAAKPNIGNMASNPGTHLR